MIRPGNINELRILWGNRNLSTQEEFMKGMLNGTQEFWVVEEETSNTLIGELHILWDSKDQDEANGINRAYLCAFRIKKDYQGLGFGAALMKTVLHRIIDEGFTEVTIGVEENAAKLIKMYNEWGFTRYIKTKCVDHHNIDSMGKARSVDIPFMIILNDLSRIKVETLKNGS